MSQPRPRVLVISELFPNRAWPAFGIFVERQTHYLRDRCDISVVAPVRVFPHLRIWKEIRRPRRLLQEARRLRDDLASIPRWDTINDQPVHYPRYTSPPKQFFHVTWGFFAYPFVHRVLKQLHQQCAFDLVHAHYASPSGVIALLARTWMKVPVVLSVHGADVHYTVKQNRFSAGTIGWIFRKVDAIIAHSTWTARQIERYGGEAHKVQIVPYGANPPEVIERRETAGANGAVNLLSVGNLLENKGHAYVLRALRELVDQGYRVRHVIVGGGPQREHLESLAGQLGLAEVVSFEGYKAHEEVWPYFAACDIFVLPSRFEGFGIVYLEALSQGKPVIGCEGAGGPDDLQKLGDCVELVKPRDVESLVRALKRLLDDPRRRHRMGTIGRRIVAEHFRWEHNAAQTLRIYEDTLRAWSERAAYEEQNLLRPPLTGAGSPGGERT